MNIRRRAFSLLELLVTVAVIALLIGLLVPALAQARDLARATAGASNLRQLAMALEVYRIDFPDQLPQARWDGAAGSLVEGLSSPCVEASPGAFETARGEPCGNNIGALFGGTVGSLSIPAAFGGSFGISDVGADERPLNRYVVDRPLIEPDQPLEVFLDPADAGMDNPFIESLGNDTSSTYTLLGSSYNLNDHALDANPAGDEFPTLVPAEGGRMPRIANPSKTWTIGSHPIYNHDDGGDRGQRWLFGRTVATLAFADGHAETALPVAEGVVNETKDYTFLPVPDWTRATP